MSEIAPAAPTRLNEVSRPGSAANAKEAPLLSLLALVFAGLIAPVAFSANKAFPLMTAIAGLLCLPLVARPRAPSRGLWLLIALVVWSLATYAWSPVAPAADQFDTLKELERITGVKLALQLTLYAAFALAMLRTPAVGALRAMKVLTGLLSLMLLVLLFERLEGAQFYSRVTSAFGRQIRPDLAVRDVAHGSYVLALFVWPVMVMLSDTGRRPLAIVFAAVTLLVWLLFGADAPVLACALGGLVFFAVWKFERTAIWACVAAVAVFFALAPLAVSLASSTGLIQAASGHIGPSWSARLGIWSFVDRLILAKPFTGWGLDASRAWPTAIPLHPHDSALQLWLELGPIGAGLVALFFAWLFSRIAELARTDRVMAGAAAACTTSYLVIGALSFGVWQEWWLALGAIAIAVCGWAAASRPPPGARLGSSELTPL